MSTIKCPDCGRKISSRTAFNHCPYCGCPISEIIRSHKNRNRWTAIVIIALGAISLFSNKDKDKGTSEKKSSETNPVEQVLDNSHVKNTSPRGVTRSDNEHEVTKNDDGTAFEPSPIVENTTSEELKVLRESSIEVSLSDLDDSIKTLLE